MIVISLKYLDVLQLSLFCNDVGGLKKFILAIYKGGGKGEAAKVLGYVISCICCFWIDCGQQSEKFRGKQNVMASQRIVPYSF